MTEWNPNNPSVIGPEFLAVRDSSIFPGITTPQVVQRFRSNSAETIAGVRLYRTVIAANGATQIVEVVPAGDEVADPAEFTVVTYAPNVLTVTAGTVQDGSGGAAVVTDIDEWPPNYTDYVEAGPNASFDLQFASGAIAPTGRIAEVAVEVVTARGYGTTSDGTVDTRRCVVSLDNGGTLHGGMLRTIPANNSAGTAGRYIWHWGEINPITGQPWTPADVAAFDSATTEVRIARQTGDGGSLIVAAVRLVVVYENSERRVATGAHVSSTVEAFDWSATIPVSSPAGAANWAKANATDYALVVRQADQGGLTPFAVPSMGVGTVHADDPAPDGLESYDVTATAVTFLTDNATTLAGSIPSAAVAVPGRLIAFVLRTTGPATSADGQPYNDVRTPGVFSGSGANQQELRTSTSDTYSGLRLAVGWFLARPTAPLLVTVRRRSDNVAVGSFSVPESTVDAVGSAALVVTDVKATDPGFALVAATQYYLDYTSATPSTATWIVGLLAVNGGAGGVTYQEATYSGGTDQADPIGGTASTALTYTPADFAAVLEAAVDPPTGLTATADAQTLPDAPPCGPTGIPYASLAWDPTVLGADFARYDVERLGVDGLTWQRIAEIVDEASDGFDDVEARLGLLESYRVRAVRSDGASSYWTDVATVTVPAAGCGYTFTSNEAPTLSVGYPDTYEGRSIRTYQFPEAGEVTYRTLYGRDYQTAFHPLSRRGVTFSRQLTIGGLAAPAAGVGPPAAAFLRDLVWASLPYVCVRDNDGNRWFASVRVPDLSAWRYHTNHALWVTVDVVEVTATPCTPSTGTNSPGGPLLFVDGDPILFVDGDPMTLVT